MLNGAQTPRLRLMHQWDAMPVEDQVSFGASPATRAVENGVPELEKQGSQRCKEETIGR